MAKKKTAPAVQEAVELTKAATPKRATLKNTKAGNGAIGAIARPLQKDAAAWRAIGWVDAE